MPVSATSSSTPASSAFRETVMVQRLGVDASEGRIDAAQSIGFLVEIGPACSGVEGIEILDFLISGQQELAANIQLQ